MNNCYHFDLVSGSSNFAKRYFFLFGCSFLLPKKPSENTATAVDCSFRHWRCKFDEYCVRHATPNLRANKIISDIIQLLVPRIENIIVFTGVDNRIHVLSVVGDGARITYLTTGDIKFTKWIRLNLRLGTRKFYFNLLIVARTRASVFVSTLRCTWLTYVGVRFIRAKLCRNVRFQVIHVVNTVEKLDLPDRLEALSYLQKITEAYKIKSLSSGKSINFGTL